MPGHPHGAPRIDDRERDGFNQARKRRVSRLRADKQPARWRQRRVMVRRPPAFLRAIRLSGPHRRTASVTPATSPGATSSFRITALATGAELILKTGHTNNGYAYSSLRAWSGLVARPFPRVTSLGIRPPVRRATCRGRAVENGTIELLENTIFPPRADNVAGSPCLVPASDVPEPFCKVVSSRPNRGRTTAGAAPAVGAISRRAQERVAAVTDLNEPTSGSLTS